MLFSWDPEDLSYFYWSPYIVLPYILPIHWQPIYKISQYFSNKYTFVNVTIRTISLSIKIRHVCKLHLTLIFWKCNCMFPVTFIYNPCGQYWLFPVSFIYNPIGNVGCFLSPYLQPHRQCWLFPVTLFTTSWAMLAVSCHLIYNLMGNVGLMSLAFPCIWPIAK